jgi:AraC-like DNA-binding protein
MIDFASAAMIRVLAQGLRELGLDPGELPADSGQARVALRQKQAVVGAAVAQGGLACLPLLGRGLHRLAHEPTHQALVSARSARDLLERWQRLERYIHSRHRCVVEACDAREARVRHVAPASGPPPSAPEDLVVAGVLAALLEAIGLTAVEVRVGPAAAFPQPDAAALARAAAGGETALWHFRWAAPAPGTGRPAGTARPAREDAVEDARGDARRDALKNAQGNAQEGAQESAQESAREDVPGADRAWPPAAQAAYRRLAADLTRPLALRELADELRMPWRTLQRRLSQAGLSYSRLLAEARCRTGAWRLLHTADPIAEVGFLSGFADQSHFTRELQRRVGLPPAAYRAAFAVNRGETGVSS